MTTHTRRDFVHGVASLPLLHGPVRFVIVPDDWPVGATVEVRYTPTETGDAAADSYKRITVHASNEVYDRIKRAADEKGISFTDLMRLAVGKYLDEMGATHD